MFPRNVIILALVVLIFTIRSASSQDGTEFINWLETTNEPFSGVAISPDVNAEYSRISLRTTRPISKGDVLFRFQKKNCLTIPGHMDLLDLAQQYLETPLFDDQRVFLILLAAKSNPSLLPSWNAWLNFLPTEFSIPLYWNKKLLAELQGTQVSSITRQVKETLNEDGKNVFQKLHMGDPEQFPKEDFGVKSLKWAKAIWRSRLQICTTATHPEGVNCFNPLTEFVDYTHQENVIIHDEILLDEYQLIATKDIPLGEPVYVSDLENFTQAQLLDYFGILGETSNFTIQVGVSLNQEENDRLYSWKRGLLQQRGLSNGQLYSLDDKSDFDPDFLFAMRVYFLTLFESDEEHLLFSDQPVGVQNEISVYQALHNLGSQKLSGFVSESVLEEQQFLQDPLLDDLSRRIVLYRMREKEILLDIVKRADSKLATLNEEWNLRTFEIPKVIYE